MRSAALWGLSGLVSLLGPSVAEACPQCASRSGGGLAQAVMLGAMILLPYAVVSIVLRAIKGELADDDAPRKRP